jgi:hypothetical protein
MDCYQGGGCLVLVLQVQRERLVPQIQVPPVWQERLVPPTQQLQVP